ncbi:MAG: PBP1A family penicillin-binding protein [Elusimicrobiota bacterium]
MPRRPRSTAYPVIAAAVVAAILFCCLWLYAERRILPLLSGDVRGAFTSRIFASPTRLRPGSPLAARELEERLARLDYTLSTRRPTAPGEFQEEGALFHVCPRAFTHPYVRPTAGCASIDMRDGAVRSLRLLSSGTPLLELVLEPELIYEISGSQSISRHPLRPSDIPEAMRHAIVAIEDRRFYRHHGVDIRAVARAAWRNLRRGRLAEGGSTLTQQLARTLFLSTRRTLGRKLQEAVLAFYIDARFSKDEILRMYLENVYFGRKGPVSLLGLGAAARHFFDKSPEGLTAGECALLAGIVAAPNRFNPFRHPDEALERRRLVLSAMREQGMLTPEAELAARREVLRLSAAGQVGPKEADYFSAHVLRKMEDDHEGEDLWDRGLIVHTTLDPWWQAQARRAVGKSRPQAALVALDPKTGAVRALVGGTDFGLSPFDRATQARRQCGSAFKPFVYGAALQAKGGAWTLASLLSDATRSYAIEGGTWSPENYDRTYRGPVPLRTAFAFSLNAATVDLAGQVGPAAIVDYARRLGIRSPLRPELGLALGVFEVGLLELAGAYCPFANSGFRVEPYAVEMALDMDGRVIEFHPHEPRPVLSPGEAYLMTSLLREAVLSGTAQDLKRWGLAGIAAGKTGTTDGGKDAWFVGYTPSVLAGVWTGSDLPSGLGLTGAGTALPIWADFVAALGHPQDTTNPWPRPEEVVAVRVDPLTGLLAHAGCPRDRMELFLAGTEPTSRCELHSGGITGWFRRVFKKR